MSVLFFFFKQKTAYEMLISDWSSDVCSSDLTEDKPAQTETTTDESTLPDTGGGEPIELTAIGKGELLRLDGDHECGFTIEGQSGPALIAKTNVGDDQLASGAYKIGGQLLRVPGDRQSDV